MASEVDVFDGEFNEEIVFDRDRVMSADTGGEELANGLIASVGQLFAGSCESVVAATESPIERLMLYALARALFRETHAIRICSEGDAVSICLTSDEEYVIRLQHSIGAYRVDFLVEYVVHWDHEKRIQLVVECDGHNFHEKTKQQAQHDKERDRNLKLCGFDIFRFTGSEIWANAEKCAMQVLDFFGSKIALI